MAAQSQIPSTPRVISPSPTPSESQQTSYFAPITRSTTKRRPSAASSTSSTVHEDGSDSSTETRARSRSRSPTTASKKASKKRKTSFANTSKPPTIPESPNGHLSPSSAATSNTSYWRSLSPSRSPSPLGLIPIHRSFRNFIHRHEIPRKLLHVSIGFVTIGLYTHGLPTARIYPWLMGALIPVATMDYARHTFPALNRFYIRCLGAMMRESEVEGYNGVIWYLLGAWAVLRFFPKDVAVVSVLLLSWCDTAASTFGRLYGRYTPRVRRGKSLAGSAAAAVTGVLTAGVFWGWVVRRWRFDEGFMFTGELGLPGFVKEAMGLGEEQGRVGGWVGLGIVSIWSGVVASCSEVVDLWGWDDNATIPILSAIGLWGFFKVFPG